jgi:dCTP deaminase
MFSRVDILAALQQKHLVIEPFDKKSLDPNAYTLHLDDEFAVAKKGVIDVEKCSDFSKYYGREKIKKGKSFLLKPRMLVLARTAEKIALSGVLGMMIDGRSTLARLGIDVTQTAMLIESGHGIPNPRKIVLEISNTGPFTVHLRPGMQIAKAIVFELRHPTDVLYDKHGKYGTREEIDALTPLPEKH